MDKEKPKVSSENKERLQKVLAQAGIASRRHAEQLILEGHVKVNGIQVTALGTKAGPHDVIEVDGKSLKRSAQLYYYLLNKPVQVITSAQDPQGRRTVTDLLKHVPARVYPVGRLDYDTSGALLLTNDGKLAHRLMHPSYGVEKTYRVWIKGPLDLKALRDLRQGVLLEDGKTAPAKVERASGVTAGPQEKLQRRGTEVLEVTIHEGRNRQIRRMFAAVGYPVLKLERICFGGLTLEKIPRPGYFRALTQHEVRELRRQVGL